MRLFIFILVLFISLFNVYSNSSDLDLINEKLNILKSLDEVKSVEEKLPLEAKNELGYSKKVINVNTLYSFPYNLSGEDIIIFQYEEHVPDNNHFDLINRVSWTGDIIDSTGHATWVAGILIGNGSINSNLTGIAPKATIRADELDSDSRYNETGGILGIPYDYGYSINVENVDLASNSWGYAIKENLNSTNKEQLCPYYGNYESNAELFDVIVFGDLTYLGSSVKPISVVFSVGNERNADDNLCNDTLINYNINYPYYTINPPKTGKNIITVGSIDDWNNESSTFSAYGPTDDERIKPDLVAPGNGIYTTTLNNTYESVQGTSFSAPQVSGTIALMLEQWNKSGYQTTLGDPLPSTIKALLLDSTVDLSRTGNGTQMIDGPDYVNGFGLLDAKGAVDRIINGTFIESNISEEYDLDVYAINITYQDTLKVTLAWDDIPNHNLVNDLDLYLLSPSGTKYYPWTLDPSNPSDPAIQTEADHDNVVEQVYISEDEIEEGQWLVVVSSTECATINCPQKYSLVSEYEIRLRI